MAIEVEQVLSDLYPLLRTVQPAQLNYTLTAIADALEGRGERIGENLVILDDYLQRMNPKIPLLVDDLGKLSQVSDVYADVVPEIATLLRNSVKTGNTFLSKEQSGRRRCSTTSPGSRGPAGTSSSATATTSSRLSKQGQRQLPVLAKYSAEYPCLLNGIVGAIPLQGEAFRDFTLHINLEVLPQQPRGYNPGDKPVYAERGGNQVPLGQCAKAINFGYSQNNLPPRSLVPNLKDGVNYPDGQGPLRSGVRRSARATRAPAPSATVLNSITAPAMGVASDDVPDLTSLLVGPLARGAEVSLR